MLGREFAHPREVFGALKAIRGHNMAKAAVEMAAWDLFARQQGLPLCRVLGGDEALIASGIASGVSIGIQDSLDELVERVEIELAAGYRRIKIKIKPGWDIEAPSNAFAPRFGAIPLMVDANAAYRLEDAAHLAALDRFDLMMIEQPLDYDDVADHAALQARIATPICLDESLHTVKIAREAIDAGRLPHHQHQARTGRRPRRVDPAARSRRVARRSRCGTAACSRAASAAPTTFTSRRCRISRCPATSRRAGATSRPTSSTRRSRSGPTAPSRCRTGPASA